MSEEILTLHGQEFGEMLAKADIKFDVYLDRDRIAVFTVRNKDADAAYSLMMELRGSKL